MDRRVEGDGDRPGVVEFGGGAGVTGVSTVDRLGEARDFRGLGVGVRGLVRNGGCLSPGVIPAKAENQTAQDGSPLSRG